VHLIDGLACLIGTTRRLWTPWHQHLGD